MREAVFEVLIVVEHQEKVTNLGKKQLLAQP
jgi:hypothetical protein